MKKVNFLIIDFFTHTYSHTFINTIKLKELIGFKKLDKPNSKYSGTKIKIKTLK